MPNSQPMLDYGYARRGNAHAAYAAGALSCVVMADIWVIIARAHYATRLHIALVCIIGAIAAASLIFPSVLAAWRALSAHRPFTWTVLVCAVVLTGSSVLCATGAYFVAEHFRNPPLRLKCQPGLRQGPTGRQTSMQHEIRRPTSNVISDWLT